MITIIGLGAGDMDQLPLGVYKQLKEVGHLYLRTKEHPVVAELEKEGITYTAFDKIYETYDTFDTVYDAIVKRLTDENEKDDIVYAVPGHPMVAERVVQLLLESDVEVEIKGGQSFLDDLFTSLKVDPIDGFQLLDATGFSVDDLSLGQHMVFCQVYNAEMASNVKLPLLEILPFDYEIFIVTAVGSNQEVIKRVPLYELDHEIVLNNLTSVYVPPIPDKLRYHELRMLRNVLSRLRGLDGCPWDQEQTHQSLKKNLIEETQELLEALDGDDIDHLIEELGDVLLQVAFHAQIGEEEGYFSMDEVIRTLNEKLIRRHPHVFGSQNVQTPEEALAIWKEMKKKERQ